jgi:hypothetical protein
MEAVNSPKSTSASAAGGWVCGTITLTVVGANLGPQPRHQIPHRRFPDRASSSSTSRCQILRAV